MRKVVRRNEKLLVVFRCKRTLIYRTRKRGRTLIHGGIMEKKVSLFGFEEKNCEGGNLLISGFHGDRFEFVQLSRPGTEIFSSHVS